MAKGYWIARVDVSDSDAYQKYVQANATAFSKYGARFIVRGGTFEVREGTSRSRNVVIELTDAAREWLAKEGYDPVFGARPLARVIQNRVKKALAEELLFGKLAKGGVVRVDFADGEPTFAYQSAERTKKRGKGRKSSKDTRELVK